MADDYVLRPEYDEYRERMKDENARQNKRIEILEESVKQNGELTLSVEKLATNMQNMLKEQEKQGKRLDSLEARDGELWRKMIGYAITAIVGIVIGYVFKLIGM